MGGVYLGCSLQACFGNQFKEFAKGSERGKHQAVAGTRKLGLRGRIYARDSPPTTLDGSIWCMRAV